LKQEECRLAYRRATCLNALDNNWLAYDQDLEGLAFALLAIADPIRLGRHNRVLRRVFQARDRQQ
jgi:hypothetical protein